MFVFGHLKNPKYEQHVLCLGSTDKHTRTFPLRLDPVFKRLTSIQSVKEQYDKYDPKNRYYFTLYLYMYIYNYSLVWCFDDDGSERSVTRSNRCSCFSTGWTAKRDN